MDSKSRRSIADRALGVFSPTPATIGPHGQIDEQSPYFLPAPPPAMYHEDCERRIVELESKLAAADVENARLNQVNSTLQNANTRLRNCNTTLVDSLRGTTTMTGRNAAQYMASSQDEGRKLLAFARKFHSWELNDAARRVISDLDMGLGAETRLKPNSRIAGLVNEIMGYEGVTPEAGIDRGKELAKVGALLRRLIVMTIVRNAVNDAQNTAHVVGTELARNYAKFGGHLRELDEMKERIRGAIAASGDEELLKLWDTGSGVWP